MRNSWVTAKGYYTKNVLFCLHTTQLSAFPYLITCSHYKQLLTQSQSAPLFPFHPYNVTTTLIAEHNHPHSNNCHRQPQHAATLLRQQVNHLSLSPYIVVPTPQCYLTKPLLYLFMFSFLILVVPPQCPFPLFLKTGPQHQYYLIPNYYQYVFGGRY